MIWDEYEFQIKFAQVWFLSVHMLFHYLSNNLWQVYDAVENPNICSTNLNSYNILLMNPM